ncbi:hypothetical protein [Acidithiobacillus thiooxidans]|uniref:Uncharacterized protein n=1 Tax=Acidithiobacillus thiooxidans ATCC 19377 TaxID=637390 RepID=A0A543Q1I0_ACITH|nr:hypothetical protein [Acidithiobacillus thiooxidans]MDX5935713.1 hypothetical protein [Acidithiobacillus thiooxidans]TQN50192.1 hypothetical protein DLNHIDIE_00029 [Acidithiobacillus thiooxidans ATCC 19377]
MKRNPLSKIKRLWLALASLPLLGAAMALPLAHAATAYVSVDGHSIPVSAQSRTIHVPGGIIWVQTVTWGAQGVPGHLQITANHLSPVQAQAMINQSLWQMRSMQVAMDQQIAQMNQLMRVSFGPFINPAFNFPEPVMMTQWFMPGTERLTPVHKSPAMAASAGPLSGHEMLSVRWRHPEKTEYPKSPI